ncbi:MAG: hypothetical protein N3A61_09925 [Ignavibacteria bacterium]|nr:hypothetical protein [Ignavibacteria bacterium]
MKIVLIGRYNQSEILSGPEKFAKRLFHYLSKSDNDVKFIDYFFKNRQDSKLLRRLFGYNQIKDEENIYRIGTIRLFFFLLKLKPDVVHIVTAERFIIPIFFYKIFFRFKICATIHSILKFEINYSPVGQKNLEF